MKRFLKRLGFHSPDEMEKAILFKAQRNAYFFLTAALFFWSLYESCQVYIYHNQLNPFLLRTARGSGLIFRVFSYHDLL